MAYCCGSNPNRPPSTKPLPGRFPPCSAASASLRCTAAWLPGPAPARHKGRLPMPDPASGYPGTENDMEMVAKQGLYDPRNEHDACGVGFVVNIKGRKSHDIIRQGLKILVNLDHRGAVGADPLVGDGAGCLIQMPDRLLRDWARQGRQTPAASPAATPSPCASCRRTSAPATTPINTSQTVVAREGQTLVGWRDVPTDLTGLGQTVIETHAGDPPGDRRRQPANQGPGRVRAEDPRHPQADPEQRPHAGRQAAPARPGRALHAVVLHPDDGLQGPVARAPGRRASTRT